MRRSLKIERPVSSFVSVVNIMNIFLNDDVLMQFSQSECPYKKNLNPLSLSCSSLSLAFPY